MLTEQLDQTDVHEGGGVRRLWTFDSGEHAQIHVHEDRVRISCLRLVLHIQSCHGDDNVEACKQATALESTPSPTKPEKGRKTDSLEISEGSDETMSNT